MNQARLTWARDEKDLSFGGSGADILRNRRSARCEPQLVGPRRPGMSDSGSTQTIEPPTAERRATGRSIGVGVCVVLAVLLTTPGLVAFWGQRTLNDAQRYLDTVGPLVHSPEVQDAIATTVTNAIEQQAAIAAVLSEVFAGVITARPRLEKLVGPLSGAVNGLIDREVREFVASDAFADIWVRGNTRARQGLGRR